MQVELTSQSAQQMNEAAALQQEKDKQVPVSQLLGSRSRVRAEPLTS